MILPLKHNPVNWVDGMKLSCAHFIATDQHTQDIIRDARSLHLTNYNYGLLGPQADISIIEKATNHVEVHVKRLHAITAEGARIDIENGQLIHNHYFQDNTNVTCHILFSVNPFERVPTGNPDPQDQPLRYPDITKGYTVSILPVTEIPPEHYNLTIGKLSYINGKITVHTDFIPPCTNIISHPTLVRYYEQFNSLMNELQLAAFSIVDKTMGKESITPLGRNIRLISEKMLDYLAQIFFQYRNTGYQQPPVYLAQCFSSLAHVFFTGIRHIETKEREEMLKYFYEWRDVTPGNFEELLAKSIALIYHHQDINSAMTLVAEFLKVVTALWKKLATLEYIGQRKENIVVAEQQLVQQVQVKRAWTLLD